MTRGCTGGREAEPKRLGSGAGSRQPCLDGPLPIPAPVTAEIDYLLGRRLGRGPQRSFIADLTAGRFTVACLEREDDGERETKLDHVPRVEARPRVAHRATPSASARSPR